jgi:hypothetical protein
MTYSNSSSRKNLLEKSPRLDHSKAKNYTAKNLAVFSFAIMSLLFNHSLERFTKSGVFL